MPECGVKENFITPNTRAILTKKEVAFCPCFVPIPFSFALNHRSFPICEIHALFKVCNDGGETRIFSEGASREKRPFLFRDGCGVRHVRRAAR